MGIKKEARPIRIDGDVAFITLTKGYEATIDTADVALVSGKHWYAYACLNTVYAARSCIRDGVRTSVSLHRTILEVPDGMKVDHVDGNGLNNRRANLRQASHSQNICNQRRRADNRSGFKGVSPSRRTSRKWMARITVEGQRKRLGYFDTPEEAHAAYVEASRRLHGNFARST